MRGFCFRLGPGRFLVALMALLWGCSDMTDQPSFKSQEAPRLASPAGSVPVKGLDLFDGTIRQENPEPATATSLQKGRALFLVNCAMCHGQEGMGDGKVGERMAPPPPPDLHVGKVQDLEDFDIFVRLTYGYGRMPGFRDRLSPAERWHLVNYVKELR